MSQEISRPKKVNRNLYQKKCAEKFSEKISTKWALKINFFQILSEEKVFTQKLLKNISYQKISAERSVPNISKKWLSDTRPKKLSRGISSKKISEEKVFTQTKWREITTQKSLQRNPYQKSVKRHSLPKDWKNGSLRILENLWTHFYENFFRQFLYEKLSEEKSTPNKFQHKLLPIKYATK